MFLYVCVAFVFVLFACLLTRIEAAQVEDYERGVCVVLCVMRLSGRAWMINE